VNTLRITMQTVVISGLNTVSTSPGGDASPLEEVTFHFDQIRWDDLTTGDSATWSSTGSL
jgi:type VI protein secretion system component Hcp